MKFTKEQLDKKSLKQLIKLVPRWARGAAEAMPEEMLRESGYVFYLIDGDYWDIKTGSFEGAQYREMSDTELSSVEKLRAEKLKLYTPRKNFENFVKAGNNKIRELECQIKSLENKLAYTKKFWKGHEGITWICEKNNIFLEDIEPFITEEFKEAFEKAKQANEKIKEVYNFCGPMPSLSIQMANMKAKHIAEQIEKLEPVFTAEQYELDRIEREKFEKEMNVEAEDESLLRLPDKL